MYEVWNSSTIILNHFLYHHFDLIKMDEVKVENLYMCNYDALQSSILNSETKTQYLVQTPKMI